MSVHVLWNLLNELGKRDNMLTLTSADKAWTTWTII